MINSKIQFCFFLKIKAVNNSVKMSLSNAVADLGHTTQRHNTVAVNKKRIVLAQSLFSESINIKNQFTTFVTASL